MLSNQSSIHQSPITINPDVLYNDPYQQEYKEHPTIEQILLSRKEGHRDFRGLDLANLDASGLDFSHCDLRGANLFGAELRCCNFEGADLREANFKDANLRGANLKEADLTDVNFTDTDLSYASLKAASLTGSLWRRTKCYCTEITQCVLPDDSLCKMPLKLSGCFTNEDLLVKVVTARQQWKKFGIIISMTGFFIAFELLKFMTPALLNIYALFLRHL